MATSGAIHTKHDDEQGYTLTVFRKEADDRWLMARDANLVS